MPTADRPVATLTPPTDSTGAVLRPMFRFGPADAPRILEHLLALDADDRLLRFSHGIRDEGIAAYVATLDLARDHVHGLGTAQGDIVALAHVAVRDGEVDFGLSVTATHRQRGLGRALFNHVIALARLHGAGRIVCHSVSPAVLHMAAASGFRRPGGNHTAPLTLDLRAESHAGDAAHPCPAPSAVGLAAA